MPNRVSPRKNPWIHLAPRQPFLRRSTIRLEVELLENRVVPTAAPGNDLLWRNYTQAEAFQLHSNPGAEQVVYLDFDGHVVAGTPWNTAYNSGNPINHLGWSMDANRAAFSPTELDKIIAMWRQVAEDMAPFDIDVTTEDPGLEALRKTSAADTQYGMRVVIGPRPSMMPSAGGIAYFFSFDDNIDNPCFVWNGDMSAVPEASLPTTVSHEVGHTFGLQHDGQTPSTTYYGGHGTAPVRWAPIMGAGFGVGVLDHWSRDTYPLANNPQDDLQVITTGFDFGYRPDDYGNDIAMATPLNGPGQAALPPLYGLIETDADDDYFTFYANAGPIDIQIDPLIDGPNLDILAELYDAAGNLIDSSNPVDDIVANLTTTITRAGVFHVRVTGTGRVDPNGYPGYGSIGSYRIGGTVVPFTKISQLGSPPSVFGPLRWIYDPASDVFVGDLTLKNNLPINLVGPVYVMMPSLAGGVSIAGTGGTTTSGTPYMRLDQNIAAGATVQVPLRIYNPNFLDLGTFFNSLNATLALDPELEDIDPSGHVFHDENRDGVRDPGERGIPNVVVELRGTTNRGATVHLTTTTDAVGFYAFIVDPGVYSLIQHQPTNYADGPLTVGTLGGTPKVNRFDGIVVRDLAGTGYDFAEWTLDPDDGSGTGGGSGGTGDGSGGGPGTGPGTEDEIEAGPLNGAYAVFTSLKTVPNGTLTLDIAAASHFTYTVAVAGGNGSLTLNGQSLAEGATFSGADATPGALIYTIFDGSGIVRIDGVDPAGNFVVSHVFELRVDRPPVLGGSFGISLLESDVFTLTNEHLNAVDQDDPPERIVYTLEAAPTNGYLRSGGAILSTGGTFTQRDIDEGRVAYQATGQYIDEFTVSVANPDSPPAGTAVVSVYIGPEINNPGNSTDTATFSDPVEGGLEEPQEPTAAPLDHSYFYDALSSESSAESQTVAPPQSSGDLPEGWIAEDELSQADPADDSYADWATPSYPDTAAIYAILFQDLLGASEDLDS